MWELVNIKMSVHKFIEIQWFLFKLSIKNGEIEGPQLSENVLQNGMLPSIGKNLSIQIWLKNCLEI